MLVLSGCNLPVSEYLKYKTFFFFFPFKIPFLVTYFLDCRSFLNYTCKVSQVVLLWDFHCMVSQTESDLNMSKEKLINPQNMFCTVLISFVIKNLLLNSTYTFHIIFFNKRKFFYIGGLHKDPVNDTCNMMHIALHIPRSGF